MKIFDLHQDLMTHMRFRDAMGQAPQTDFNALEESPVALVVATAFPLPASEDQRDSSALELIEEELTLYREYVSESTDWLIVREVEDLRAPKKKLLLHIEGLNVFADTTASWQTLHNWVIEGVRSVGTHWNIANALGGGTLQPELPLTPLGVEVISYLETNNIIFDMAHMGRATWWDAAKQSTRPLYVSHGNADAVRPHLRNYTDAQLYAIAESGGLMGVFFPKTFTVPKGGDTTRSAVINQIEYIRHLIGIEHIAIGSDFGGIVSGCVKGLSHVRDMPALFDDLYELGYTDEMIDLLAWKNAARVLSTHLA